MLNPPKVRAFLGTLLIFILFPISLWGQMGYYGRNGAFLPLQIDSSRLVIAFHSSYPTDELELAAANARVQVQYDGYTESGMAVFRSNLPWDNFTSDFASQIFGIDTSRIAEVYPAHILPDGLELVLKSQVVCRLLPGVDSAFLEGVASQLGGTAMYSKRKNWIIEVGAAMNAPEVAAGLYDLGIVAWAQPDFWVKMDPADPYSGDQYYLDNTGQLIDGVAGLADIDIDAPEAWNYEQGDSNIVVAVFDNGVEVHADLVDTLGNTRLLPGYSIINPGAGSGDPLVNIEMHGQACAGIIAAGHNGIGIQGVAPGVKILPVYSPYSLLVPISQISDGIDWANIEGADVINCSWGLSSCDTTGYPVLVTAIDEARNLGRGGLGCVLVFAAGNDYQGCVRFPAMMDSTIAVGAIDRLGNVAPYSNHGSELDVVAPSAGAVEDVRTIDRSGANGINVNGIGDLPNTDYTRQFGGTSTATSITSGVAALVLSRLPTLTAGQVRDIIRASADDMGMVGVDTVFGYGRLNAYQALMTADSYAPLSGNELRLAIERRESDGVWLAAHVPGDWDKLLLETKSQQQTRTVRSLQPSADWLSWKEPFSNQMSPQYVRLRGTTVEGGVSYSNWVEISKSGHNGLNVKSLQAGESFLSFEIDTENWPCSVQVMDVAGRSVTSPLSVDSSQGQPNQIPLSFGSGVFLLQVQDAKGQRITQRFFR